MSSSASTVTDVVLLQGYVKKEGHQVRNWKKRLMVVRMGHRGHSDLVSYYADKNALRGEFFFSTRSSVSIPDLSIPKRNYLLQIVGWVIERGVETEKVFRLSFEDEQTRNEWKMRLEQELLRLRADEIAVELDQRCARLTADLAPRFSNTTVPFKMDWSTFTEAAVLSDSRDAFSYLESRFVPEMVSHMRSEYDGASFSRVIQEVRVVFDAKAAGAPPKTSGLLEGHLLVVYPPSPESFDFEAFLHELRTKNPDIRDVMLNLKRVQRAADASLNPEDTVKADLLVYKIIASPKAQDILMLLQCSAPIELVSELLELIHRKHPDFVPLLKRHLRCILFDINTEDEPVSLSLKVSDGILRTPIKGTAADELPQLPFAEEFLPVIAQWVSLHRIITSLELDVVADLQERLNDVFGADAPVQSVIDGFSLVRNLSPELADQAIDQWKEHVFHPVLGSLAKLSEKDDVKDLISKTVRVIRFQARDTSCHQWFKVDVIEHVLHVYAPVQDMDTFPREDCLTQTLSALLRVQHHLLGLELEKAVLRLSNVSPDCHFSFQNWQRICEEEAACRLLRRCIKKKKLAKHWKKAFKSFFKETPHFHLFDDVGEESPFISVCPDLVGRTSEVLSNAVIRLEPPSDVPTRVVSLEPEGLVLRWTVSFVDGEDPNVTVQPSSQEEMQSEIIRCLLQEKVHGLLADFVAREFSYQETMFREGGVLHGIFEREVPLSLGTPADRLSGVLRHHFNHWDLLNLLKAWRSCSFSLSKRLELALDKLQEDSPAALASLCERLQQVVLLMLPSGAEIPSSDDESPVLYQGDCFKLQRIPQPEKKLLAPRTRSLVPPPPPPPPALAQRASNDSPFLKTRERSGSTSSSSSSSSTSSSSSSDPSNEDLLVDFVEAEFEEEPQAAPWDDPLLLTIAVRVPMGSVDADGAEEALAEASFPDVEHFLTETWTSIFHEQGVLREAALSQVASHRDAFQREQSQRKQRALQEALERRAAAKAEARERRREEKKARKAEAQQRAEAEAEAEAERQALVDAEAARVERQREEAEAEAQVERQREEAEAKAQVERQREEAEAEAQVEAQAQEEAQAEARRLAEQEAQRLARAAAQAARKSAPDASGETAAKADTAEKQGATDDVSPSASGGVESEDGAERSGPVVRPSVVGLPPSPAPAPVSVRSEQVSPCEASPSTSAPSSQHSSPPKNAGKDLAWMKTLQAGFLLLKHGRRGSPHKRFVYVDSALENILWTHKDVAQNPSAPHKHRVSSCPLREFTEVLIGLNTHTIRRKASESIASQCFSLVGSSGARTLDFTANSSDMCEELADCFNALFKYHRQHSPTAAGSSFDV